MKKHLLILSILFCSLPVFGADHELNGSASRNLNKVGFSVSLSPLILSGTLNVHYNFTDFLQIYGGAGTSLWKATVGNNETQTRLLLVTAGANFYVPNWSCSPELGVAVVHMALAPQVTIQNIASDMVTFKVGFDWQTKGGFDIAFGYDIFASSLVGMPYFRLGLFF